MYFRFALYGFLKNLRFFEPFIVLFFLEKGLSYFEIGLLYSTRSVVTNVLEIPSGVYADVFGRRRSLVLSFCVYLLSFACFSLAGGFWGCALAMALFGFAEAFRSGTHKALIFAFLEQESRLDEKISYYGKTRAASQLGSALNALLAAAFVVGMDHYRYLFAISAVPYALGLINLLSYPRRLDAHLDASARTGVRIRLRSIIADLIVALRNRYVLRTILNVASFGGGFKSGKDYLQPVLESIALAVVVLPGVDNQTAVVIGVTYFGVHLLSGVASRSSAGFSRWLGGSEAALNRLYLVGAVVLVAGGYGYHMALPYAAAAGLLVVYIIQNIRRPIGVGVLSDQVGSRVTASALSAESQASTLLEALLAPVLGVIADRAGIGPALIALGITLLVILPFVRCVRRPA